MFGSNMLEVALGVIFVFILVSIICTAVREGLESWLKTRAAYLEHGIRQLLADNAGTGLAKNLYNHPLIFGLFTEGYKPGKTSGSPALFAKGGNLPSYIPSKNFALAIIDIAARGPITNDVNSDPNTPVISLDILRQNVANLGSPTVQRLLINAIDSAQGDLNKAQANIEDWYNSGMDRVSGWYKRSTQIIIFAVALLVSIGLNINTLTIADYLTKNETAREMLVKKAEAINKQGLPDNQTYDSAKAELNSLGLPIGWSQLNSNTDANSLVGIFFGGIIGWLLTALAASLGAPFWFDTLNKVMVIRSTVKPHEKSQEEASEDRQAPVNKGQVATPDITAPVVTAPVVAFPAIQPAVAATPVISQGQQPSVADDDTEVDGCDVEATDKTNDEDLPPTQGGVV
jgi:hypothetical protein